VISVVIPVYNAADVVGEQLDALAAQTYEGEWEVVIADNGSTDGSREVVLRWSDRLPSLRVVDASDGSGAGHARNVGLAAARGDLLLFCDADDVVVPRWVAAMAAAPADCDLLGGALEDETLNDEISRSWRWRPAPQLRRTLDFLPFASSNNIGVRRRVFETVGGWNVEYLHGGEDVELCWRAQVAGHKLCYVPDAVLRVRYRRSLRSLIRQFYFYGIATPRLYRDFRSHGVPPKPLGASAREWLRLLIRLPDLVRSSRARGTWIRLFATACGRIRGSVRYRVVYL
jgi:glycosyltransferase involved in cell wall biosynthesis